MQEYAATVCRNIPVTPLGQKILYVELSNLQDVFISKKTMHGIIFCLTFKTNHGRLFDIIKKFCYYFQNQPQLYVWYNQGVLLPLYSKK